MKNSHDPGSRSHCSVFLFTISLFCSASHVFNGAPAAASRARLRTVLSQYLPAGQGFVLPVFPTNGSKKNPS